MPRRSIVCALLLCYLAACTTWHTSDWASLKPLIASKQITTVRVTWTGGARKVLHLIYISGDTLVGFRRGDPTRIALSDITQVAIPRAATGRTIAICLGLASVFAVSAAVITNANKKAGGEAVP